MSINDSFKGLMEQEFCPKDVCKKLKGDRLEKVKTLSRFVNDTKDRLEKEDCAPFHQRVVPHFLMASLVKEIGNIQEALSELSSECFDFRGELKVDRKISLNPTQDLAGEVIRYCKAARAARVRPQRSSTITDVPGRQMS